MSIHVKQKRKRGIGKYTKSILIYFEFALVEGRRYFSKAQMSSRSLFIRSLAVCLKNMQLRRGKAGN